MQQAAKRSFKKGYKFRIYPNKEQRELFAKTFGCCRFVWNQVLASLQQEYQTYLKEKETLLNPKKPQVSGYSLVNRIHDLKTEHEWLHEVSAVALQQILLNLGQSYSNFFAKHAKAPKFKTKHGPQSFRLVGNGFRFKDNEFKTAKCKDPIKIQLSRDLPSAPSSVVISQTASGKYYASFICEYEESDHLAPARTIGLDLGLKHFLVTSNGGKTDSPKFYRKAQQKLRRLQQSHSRKKKGSKNREKSRKLLARQHEHVVNQRNDFLHKLSRSLVNENQVIGIENLCVRNMVKNRRLAKSISDSGWGRFKELVTYKVMESKNSHLVIMDTFFPSSHLCSNTGQRREKKLTLSEREWDCPHCGERHDRDINAALNIRHQALRELVRIGYPKTDIRVLKASLH